MVCCVFTACMQKIQQQQQQQQQVKGREWRLRLGKEASAEQGTCEHELLL